MISVSLGAIPGKVIEKIIKEYYHVTLTGQSGDQAQTVQVYERQVLPN